MTIWTLQTSTTFKKQLNALERVQKERILKFFKTRVLTADNPRTLAKSLSGELAGYWRFSVGNYRIIADIQDEACIIIGIDVGHRREIYD